MINSQAVINKLPVKGLTYPIYITITADGSPLDVATITNVSILYGNVTVGINPAYFLPQDNQPIALAITSIYNGATYFNILYTKAIYGQQMPDNFRLLIQKLPLGVFTDTSKDSEVGGIFAAKAQMIDDYYLQYFYTQKQAFASTYSPQLEYEYNQTVGLLKQSVYVTNLFNLLSSLNTVALNTYALELFVTKYIYYRIGSTCAVYINDHVSPFSKFWNLGHPIYGVLGSTTVLAGEGDTPAVLSLDWTIFNSNATNFTIEFKSELTKLIIRISRADINNTIAFNAAVDPVTAGGFTAQSYTYPNDPRMIYGKCLAYLGDNAFPLNILGYTANF